MSPGRLGKEVEGRSLLVLVLQLLGRRQGTCDAEEKTLGSVLGEWLFPAYRDVEGEAL